jgi:LysM repeat protein
MGTYHTVVQGEYVSGIAKKYGFSSYKKIWDHAQNAELKKQRQNPNVIFPGDQLFIPDKSEKKETRSTGQRHQFVLKTEKLKLRLVLEDLYEKPIANAQCELSVENETFRLTTDGKGKIEKDIKPGARSAVLTIKDPQTPINKVLIPIKIGDLDPVDKEPGQKARLNNLGYFAGPLAGTKEAEKENKALFLSAVEEFQCDHGLAVDGKCGPATQAKLKQVHGC